MVVKMMRWRPWPPLLSKKFDVTLIIQSLDGCQHLLPQEIAEIPPEMPRLMTEVRWKGSKIAFSLRRTVKRNSTKDENLQSTGSVEWNEEFRNVCTLSAYKENAFHPWEITLTVCAGLNQGCKSKTAVVGTASVNLAEIISEAGQRDHAIELPVSLAGSASEHHPCLHLSISLLELGISQESLQTVHGSIAPVPLLPFSGVGHSAEKEELSALKAGLRKVKILTEYVSTRKSRKACFEEESSEGRCSGGCEDAECTYTFDLSSCDELDGDLEDGKESPSFRKSFSYDTLASANYFQGFYCSDICINREDDDWIYYSNQKPDSSCASLDKPSSFSEPSRSQASKRGILSWRKRKLNFRSPKSKGEPLLKKAYEEDGGDDIDFDRRQLSSADYSLVMMGIELDEVLARKQCSELKFGDDNFKVGSWEHREITSRDGCMKLCTSVFFASIDQRSEQAAGESACTALVAVIADWLQINHDIMPIKSQFDSLIREGSREWRNLCANLTYKERFPDKHFDLETVLQAKVRNISVVAEKSFIGFFHPDEGFDEGFAFLHGAMSFDNIWDEISHAGSNSMGDASPRIYIVSWNDHFFVLKIEPHACYLVDTLGERLYEGCNRAYILRFDENTSISKLLSGKECKDENKKIEGDSGVDEVEGHLREEVAYRGKDACKEYIKNFLAAIPIRELQVDVKKGLTASAPLHHRLQIEFHLTDCDQAAVVAQAAASGAIHDRTDLTAD